ncbi:MAG: 2-oxo acid dehydrogenase subunit E2 [Deltaproteobacteria bacterium]|nr:2-oxo acid dehydrogenase subunit E2 [Deltaproteobacteria bacterium]
MADKIVMPQLGESIAEGTIVRWLKQPGDTVRKDENVLVISTDKVEAEIPAPAAGVLLSIDVGEGKTVGVGTVLGFVGSAGERTSQGGASAAPPAAVPVTRSPSRALPAEAAPAALAEHAGAFQLPAHGGNGSGGRFVSPLVRSIAGEHGVSDAELDLLPGTGNNGRVTKRDLLAYVEARRAGRAPLAAAPLAAAPSAAAAMPAAKPSFSPPSATLAPQPARAFEVSIPTGQNEVLKPASTMRKVIMQNMVASKTTSAHVHTFFDVDWTNVEKVRRAHKDRFKAEEGVPLTFTVFMAAALAQCLKRHSYVNAEVRGTDIAFKKDVHLGMAVAIDQPEPGLMVPVIKHADQMNLRGLARAIADLAARVRSKKVRPDELSGSTFTLTHPGNFGSIIGTPVINQPNVGILAMGKIEKKPVVMEVDGTDVIAVRLRSVIALGFDHRLIDGATADQFMADLVKTLEGWTALP